MSIALRRSAGARTTSSATIATPPRNSIIGGSSDTVLVIFRFVRYSRSDAAPNRSASCRSAAERLDDAVAGERFRRQMRQVLEMFLAPPRRAPDPLAQTDERIDHQRRAGQGDERQPPVEVEHQRRRNRSPTGLAQKIADVSETACCTWLTSLVMRDIS